MKKKIIALITTIFIMCTLIPTLSFAEGADFVIFDNFDNYQQYVTKEDSSPWTGQTTGTAALKIPIVETDRGKSAYVETVEGSSAHVQLQSNFSYISEDTASVFCSYTIKLNDLNSSKRIQVRCDDDVYRIINNFEPNGTVYIGAQALSGFTAKAGEWYTVSWHWDMKTAFVKGVLIDEAGNAYETTGSLNRTGLKRMYTLDFNAQPASSKVPSGIYIDDVVLKTSKEHISATSMIHDFESFESDPDGQKAYGNLYLQNNAIGQSGLYSEDSGDEQRGLCARMESDGSRSFEVCNKIPAETVSIHTGVDIRFNEGSRVRFMLRDNTKWHQLFIVTQGGNYYCGSDPIKQIDMSKWYRFDLRLDITNKVYTCVMTSEDGEAISTQVPLPATLDSPYAVSVSSMSSYTCNISIDNYFMKGSGESFSFLNSNPVSGSIVSEDTTTVKIDFNDDINTDNALVYVNTRKLDSSAYSTNGKSILINTDFLEPGGFYVISCENVADSGGNTASGYCVLQTRPMFSFKPIDINLESGVVRASSSAFSRDENLPDATLLLAVYDKATNKMLGISCVYASLNDMYQEFDTELNFDADADVYAQAYWINNLWDMKLLSTPKKI